MSNTKHKKDLSLNVIFYHVRLSIQNGEHEYYATGGRT